MLLVNFLRALCNMIIKDSSDCFDIGSRTIQSVLGTSTKVLNYRIRINKTFIK